MTSKVDLTPAVLDLDLYAGDGADFQLKFTDSNNAAVDVSDRTCSAQIRKTRSDATSYNLTIITTNAATGIVVIHIPGSITSILPRTSQWDLQFTSASRPDPFTILQGTVTCIPDVTRS